MRLSTKQRGYFDALGVLICEVSLLVVFLRANSLLGTVDLSHFTTWLRTTSPERAVTAWVRLLGTAVCGWLLLSTLLYGAAALSGKRGLIKQARLVTVPLLRRALDTIAAASVAASSIGSTAAMAAASVPARPVATVQPLQPTQPQRGVAAATAPQPMPSWPVSTTAVKPPGLVVTLLNAPGVDWLS